MGRYRFKDGEWKERGLGESKLLRHRARLASFILGLDAFMRCWQESGKIRYMMRQEKTGKIAWGSVEAEGEVRQVVVVFDCKKQVISSFRRLTEIN